jgi:HAD superfamily hydrolase (TIGR01509 family)
LLDLDGTLADSLGVMYSVYAQFLARVGRAGDATAKEFAALNGPRLEEVVIRLREAHRLDDSSVEELLLLYREVLEEAMLAVRPSLGAEALLTKARRDGWSTCVVTSSRSDLTRRWLGVSGLERLVDHVVGGEMVRKGKPDPESYLAGLALCDADPQASVAVEDTVLGAQAAIAAGIRTLFLDPSGDGEPPPPPGVAGVVQGLADVAAELDR